MHTNYHFLKRLVPQLQARLQGLKLMACFSQSKDEVVLSFAAAKGIKKNYKEFFIKADLSAANVGLYFAKDFQRARRNTITLWPELTELEVLNLYTVPFDRSFVIELEQDYQLLFKLHGNRSNLLILKSGEVEQLFHERMEADIQLTQVALAKQPTLTREAFEQVQGNFAKFLPTLGKHNLAFLEEKTDNGTLADKWQAVSALLTAFEEAPFRVVSYRGEILLTVLPIGQTLFESADLLEVANQYYIASVKTSALDTEKAKVLRYLYKRKKQTDNYLKGIFTQLDAVQNQANNEHLGHILMANLHQVPERATQVELFDFFREKPVVIKLKEDLTPQKNAEHYYRKAKNERIEIEKLEENFEERSKLANLLARQIAEIEAIEDVRTLRNYSKKEGFFLENNSLETSAELFKNYSFQGFDILVGRNAKNNDLLTQRFAFKEDLWLHARDVSGSHVVVKYQAGKNYPNQVIEYAAGLAAYHSKRRNEKYVPVIMTRKKFVRKTKGLAEGQVRVEKEEVILVEPVSGK